MNKPETVVLSGLSGLSSQIASGTLRLVLTSDQQGYGTFTGAANATVGAPSLVVVQAAPEPSALAALGLGALGLLRRRRAR